MKPAVKREFFYYVVQQFKVSLRLACRAVGISSSIYRYKAKQHRDDMVIKKIQEIGKRRLPSRNPAPLAVPEHMNACWSIDFVSDALHCGRKFRTGQLQT
ncbi:hypothetical protein VIBRN418_14248 [Vibrio sp. N418]|nr:hypothetical protein VIBRN418_14248 [Vibrio sp. N418]